MPAKIGGPLVPMECSVLVEIEWEFPDGDDDINWKFLNQEANFSHRDACEFILHIGAGEAKQDAYWSNMVHRMKEFGCTDDFIDAYIAAKNTGAMRVMFWS